MVMPGPSDPLRTAGAASLLLPARRAAAACGVTRLAELTRLDRIGLPVWHAVRPMSRALSVHQGKGASDAEAQVGALLEAVESHHAENVRYDGPKCRFEDLPVQARPPTLTDFARDRAEPPAPDTRHEWLEALDLVSGGPIHLPFDLVSLDFTRNVPSPFDRASDGVAAGASREEAIAVALHEIVERDAVVEWKSRGLFACTADALQVETVPFDWFHDWIGRIEAAGADPAFYLVPSITGTPVFVCELNDFDKDGAPYRATWGSGCHPYPELALFKALAEAVQSRATIISGARDDLPSKYRRVGDGAVVAFGLPLAPSMKGRGWDEIDPGPVGCGALAEALARAGYPQVAIFALGAPEGLYVVKAFVCGLGANERRRRAPLQ